MKIDGLTFRALGEIWPPSKGYGPHAVEIEERQVEGVPALLITGHFDDQREGRYTTSYLAIGGKAILIPNR